MPHDVFISYCKEDKAYADAICDRLEGHDIHCWIAPRDVSFGKDWGESIVRAIGEAKVMVVVFSATTSSSVHVTREVERAISKGVVVVPFRVADVEPSGALEYYLSTAQWLDALHPPLETHLNRLTEIVTPIVQAQGSTKPPPKIKIPMQVPPQVPIQNKSGMPTLLKVGIGVAIAFVVLFLGGVIWAAASSHNNTSSTTSSTDGTTGDGTTGTDLSGSTSSTDGSGTSSTDSSTGTGTTAAASSTGSTTGTTGSTTTDGDGSGTNSSSGSDSGFGLARTATAKLKVTYSDGSVGTETQSQEVSENMSYIADNLYETTVSGQTQTREYKDWYDSAGTPQRMEYIERGANPNDVKAWTATFDATSAHVTEPDGTTTTIDRPEGAPTTDLADLWFILVKKPVPGTAYDVCDFSLANQAWLRSNRRYVGVEPIEVLDQQVNAYHEVDTDPDGTVTDRYFDADGNTLKESSTAGFHTERVLN